MKNSNPFRYLKTSPEVIYRNRRTGIAMEPLTRLIASGIYVLGDTPRAQTVLVLKSINPQHHIQSLYLQSDIGHSRVKPKNVPGSSLCHAGAEQARI
jgi:hypothetical protein